MTNSIHARVHRPTYKRLQEFSKRYKLTIPLVIDELVMIHLKEMTKNYEKSVDK